MGKKQKAILRTQAEKDALRIATGRPTKYDPSVIDKFLEYFSKPPFEVKEVDVVTKTGDVIKVTKEVANCFPTLSGFAISLGISRDSLHQWSKDYPEFSDVYKRAKDFQEHFLSVNGNRGLINPAFGIFTAKNMTGWTDKQEVKVDGQIDSKITVQPFDIEERKKQLKGEK